MPQPIDAALLQQWETARQATLPRRTAALIALGWPQADAEDCAALPLGEANRCLLLLRERAFGRRLVGVSKCTSCGDLLEFAVDSRVLADTADLPGASNPSPAQATQARQIEHDGCQVTLRLPTLSDCIAAADAPDATAAYQVLMDRCVTATAADGTPLHTLPPALALQLDTALEAADSGAEWRLELACPSCGQHSEAALDMAAFYTAELDAHAPRLLAEVHLMASRYGWSEAEILAMSRLRRDHYLRLVLS